MMSSSLSKVQLLLKTRSELCQQILQTEILIYEEELKKRNDNFEVESSLDELKNSVGEASDELFALNAQCRIQELALNRLKLGQTAVACLCTSPDMPDKENTSPPDKNQYIFNLMSEQMNLVTLVMQLYAEVQNLEDMLWKSRKKSKELQSTTLKLMAEFTDMKAARRSSRMKGESSRIEDDIKEDLELADVLQQVLLKLIQGSGINWAADEKLLQLVLMLGTPFKLN